MTGATPGETAVLRDADGKEVATDTVDAFGSTLFRDVPTGAATSCASAGPPSGRSRCSTRHGPPQSLYSGQDLQPGYGYLKTRDGTLLSINVKLPGPADQGPYPTVVEYSGYDPSNPDEGAARVARSRSCSGSRRSA